MYPKMSPICWKCKKKEGTYYHMWWSCPEARKYWLKIKEWLQGITNEQLELEPELFQLGIFKKKYVKSTKYLLLYILTAARIAFAQCWKQPSIPSEKLIIQKVMSCAEMDTLTLSLKDKEASIFYKVWEQWYNWIERR
uniref:Reverse transcriptase zinc-binding domain-containing protein n=1 Tax=Micrurus corallinus TaxID=54390 RepID=A0A2D4GQQ4_MICCO